MRNLITRAVFDKTFKAGDKFSEPDLVMAKASFSYADGDGFHFMDQSSYETLTLNADQTGDDKFLLVDNLEIQMHKYNGNPISLQFPALVEMTIASTEPAVRGDTSSGSVTKAAKTSTGLDIKVPLFIKEGERINVHTETREFAGRA
jgi:elongation factor P